MPENIKQTLQELETIDSSYDKRRQVDKLREAKTEYVITAIAAEINRNYSYVREDGYREGYGFLGKVEGISSGIKILLPSDWNEKAETWTVGEEHSFTVRFLDWDSPYKQYKLLATDTVSATKPTTAIVPTIPDSTTTTDSASVSTEPFSPTSEPKAEGKTVPPVVPGKTKTVRPETKAKPNIRKVQRPKATTKPEVESSFKSPETPSRNQPVQRWKTTPTEQPAGQFQESEAAPEQTPLSLPEQSKTYTPTPVDLSKYSPPTLQGVPILERVKTFGGGHKPMTPLIHSQRFTEKPRNPFELSQEEYKKPLILGLKIFGGIFAAFLLLSCICCGAMT